MLTTLLVDDDRAFLAIAAAALQREGAQVTLAHSLHEARSRVAGAEFELVVLDRRLPDGDGLEFLPELRRALPDAVVVMVTAHGDIASAVEAVRLGATDYLAKPIELSDLLFKARRASEDLRVRERLQHAEGELSGRRSLIEPVAPSMKTLVATLERIASTSPRSPVLLLGETGSGKEALAWHLHVKSFGTAAPFIQLNCAALPESMAESELFGHERGAFTDAKSTRRGVVELAHRGTLFLDEVGELSAPLQAKLLTFLDGGRFRRLGGATELASTARVVAATNRDLAAQVKLGRFREDLWFRLSVFRLDVPPLRERREDVPSLAEGLLLRVAKEQGRRKVPKLSPDALERLGRYHFPGNVRELRNILERALALESGTEISLDWLVMPAPGASVVAGFVSQEVETLDSLERRYARWALEQNGGRRLDTAKALGISHPTFNKLVREENE
ncbi:MAG: sigma-54-dependent Fis family transcriptional regulator [Archangium gephyra]|uniref:Sigma-54-dependent Fis family transcriptional regulator n=1 Tax=Archangium gephyra TaxID=48 RepID=A0A2W5T9D4_9BACT|nr:MAG: sigma-54-dependent Fis family transcriptional regulator [Archangium gephyra]